MIKPKNYDNTQAVGEFIPLPVGGYVCRIMSVVEKKSRNNNDMLVISLDIAEGKYENYYFNKYKADIRSKSEKKWGCINYVLPLDKEGNCSRKFKSFTTSLENSNEGFDIVWGEEFADSLKGKIIGVIFGREQYIGTDGNKYMSIKPMFFRSVETIKNGDFKVPEDKLLTDGGNTYYTAEDVADDEELPF